jgi:hypothetical protein
LDRIREITDKFAKAKKVIRCGEWIIVPTTLKHQKYTVNKNVVDSIIEHLTAVPEEVFEALRGCGYPLDLNAIRPKKRSPSPTPGEPLPSPSPTPGENLIELNLIESKFNKEFNVEFNDNPQSGQLVDNSGYKPTTTTFLTVQEKAKAAGYFLSERQAAAFLVLDTLWLSGRHNFLDFAARKISDDPVYSGKSRADQERIFAKGWKYENWLQEYPDWLTLQIKADERRAREELLEQLRNTPPPTCPHCGTDMGGECNCPNCNGYVLFNEENRTWEYKELSGSFFANHLKNRKLPGGNNEPEEPKQADDDIDF